MVPSVEAQTSFDQGRGIEQHPTQRDHDFRISFLLFKQKGETHPQRLTLLYSTVPGRTYLSNSVALSCSRVEKAVQDALAAPFRVEGVVVWLFLATLLTL
jgi:hypothetical protein